MRVNVTTMRLSGGAIPQPDSKPHTTNAGELTIDSEEIAELGAQVTVARLRTDGTTQASELLPPLIDAKLTELADDTFALTGIEIRGASRFAQAWYCKVHLWKPVVPDIVEMLDREPSSEAGGQPERGDARVLLGPDSRGLS